MAKKIDREKVLEVFNALALFCAVIALLTRSTYVLGGAVGILCVGLFLKGVSKVVARVWLSFSERLGTVMTGILLSVVFFVILTPIAVLFRLFHKNVLQLKRARDNESKSYYQIRNHLYHRSDLENPW